MTPERWRQITVIYKDADSAPPAERAKVLDRLCQGDPDLRREVEQLLADDGSSMLFHRAIGLEAASFSDSPLRQERFGHYRLVRRIGQGGMGAVYEAVRVDDFHKRVALKVIKQEFDSDFARARFQQERQVLAALEHPYIARLLDGGEAADGSPYLVLEFVDGQPIDRYAADLDVDARLRLFIKVCDAVQHAHRNLVIHRDLKPANILVTAEGVPKLLDFGIAKLLDPAATATQTALAALTPDYASPEQVRGLPITTASDVYSLGVILYQLLTGRKPYSLGQSSLFEMERAICQEPPEPPQLGNELDYILLMALRKEPERRYATVQQFGEDIERYLDNRTVRAQPDTTWYRTSKYVRRHWVGLLSAAIAVLGLCIGAGVAIYNAKIAQQRFNDVRELANTFLSDFDKEITSIPGSTRAREMLAATSQKYLDSLAKTAGNDKGLLVDLATSYEKLGDVQGMPGRSNLGRTREAQQSYRKAIAILERLSQSDPKYRSRLAADLAFSSRIAGELNEPETALDSASRAADLANTLRLESPDDGDLLRGAARSYDVLGSIQQGLYRSDEAVKSSRMAVDLSEHYLAAHPAPKASHSLSLSLSRLGMAYRGVADLDAGEEVLRRGRAIEDKLLAANPRELTYLAALANIEEDLAAIAYSERYPNRGDLNASVTHWQAALKIYERLLDADKNDVKTRTQVISSSAGLALVYFRRNTGDDARLADELSESATRDLEATLKKTPGALFLRNRQPLVGSIRALVLASRGRKNEAIAESGQALEGQRATTNASRSSIDTRLDLAGQLLRHAEVLTDAQWDKAEALSLSREADTLLAGLETEFHRWISMAYQAGAYRFALAQAQENVTKTSPDAARNYGEAARLWTPWQSGKPNIQGKVAHALAGQSRCRH